MADVRFFLACLFVGVSGVAAAPITVNENSGPTYDSHPSAVQIEVGGEGRTWMAWHAYHRSRDRVLAREIRPGSLGPVREVSDPKIAVNGPPKLVASGREIWVVWPASAGEHRWQIFARRFDLEEEEWGPAEAVSDPADGPAIFPAAQADADGLTVAWSGARDSEFGVWMRVREVETGSWGAAERISPAGVDAFRPVFEDGGGEARVFWDQRGESGRYVVMSRVVRPKFGPAHQVSPPGEGDYLTPAAIHTQAGWTAAWLHKIDVMGGPGVISQLHTLQAARLGPDGRWNLVETADGAENFGAELNQGLMAAVKPSIVATGGYLGRRTAPMLLDDGGRVWMLWERKTDHRGSTPFVAGDLLARAIENQPVWGESRTVHTGLVDYHLPHPAKIGAGGDFAVLASHLPRKYRRIYELSRMNLDDAEPVQQPRWEGWEPVKLPIAEEQTKRREVEIDGQRYRLFWGDFHCHSGLTSDAEGQPDEMTFYARDRAKLDVVAFTNNDYLYDVPLTEYEYALGNLLAAIYSRPGSFVSLPGYEWTSRIPGVEGVADSAPGNWTPPYKNRSYPNHRSVIYPPAGGPLVRFPEVANDIGILNEAVQEAGGLTLTQHDAFKPSGHAVEVGMELTSGWGNYINRRPNLFHQPLNDGVRLGFVACGDTHRRAPGLSGALTGLYLRELTAEAVLEALRERRCYATSGSKIFLDARANGSFMGSETQAANGAATLKLRAVGTRPIKSAKLIRDGETIAEFEGNGAKEAEFTHVDRDLPAGTHWYYWQVEQHRPAPLRLPGNTAAAHGHLAWSSPHWVTAP